MNAGALGLVQIATPMKRIAIFLPCLALSFATLQAADQTREIQKELKEEGFYFGEVDGTAGPALSAAIKRFQIRNGLEVTGDASQETLSALGIGGQKPAATAKSAPIPGLKSAPARPAPAPQQQSVTRAPAPEVARRPPVDLRKNEEIVESDRRALRETAPQVVPRDPSVVPPPADPYRGPVVEGRSRYAEIYAATPFATAPAALQEQTLRAAQRMLAGQGYYSDAVDGDPGPATEEAILSYQRAHRIPLTGRLDLETLNALRLLPGPGSANPGLKPFTVPRGTSRAYRGVWVQ